MMKKPTWIFVLFIYLVVANMVFAGSYEQIEGKGIAVCDAYFQYLKTQRGPLTCKREFPSEILQLQRPSWLQLDLNENKLLAIRIENYLQIPRDEKSTLPWTPAWGEDELSDFSVTKPGRSLFIADIDIDNDGIKETVTKYRSYSCHTWDFPTKEPSWKAPIVVVDENKQFVNIERTYPLMQNRDKRYLANYDELQVRFNELERKRKARKNEIYRRMKAGESYVDLTESLPVVSVPKVEAKFKPSVFAAGSAKHQGYDVFVFNNITYFDKWDEELKESRYQVLSVYKNNKGTVETLCRFQYHN